jgi:transposase-like protein
MLDRESREIRVKVVPNVRKEKLQKEIIGTIEFGSKIYTDQAVAYTSLKDKYIRDTVNHSIQYVNGAVHTNGLENFWSLMKRNLKGTYVAVEPFHLDRYLDEQVFRFNTCKSHNDSTRFQKALLTGKWQAPHLERTDGQGCRFKRVLGISLFGGVRVSTMR